MNVSGHHRYGGLTPTARGLDIVLQNVLSNGVSDCHVTSPT